MYVSTFLQPIAKVGRKRAAWTATRTYRRLDSLHRSMGTAVGANLQTGLKKFKSRIQPQKVYDAWLSGNWSPVMESLPWEHLHADLEPAVQKAGKTLVDAGGITLMALPPQINKRLRWDASNPSIRHFIASRRAANFTRLSEDSAKNIRSWVTDSLNRALTPRQVADGIKDSIGLLPAHALAVRRYTAGLGDKGYPPSSMQKLGSAYADRLLDYRAMMIGRTETRLATNQGQLAVWRQAADEGLIDRTTTGKRWITGGAPCEDCEPMDGLTVPLDGFWTLPDGTPVDCPPLDVHPHCECGMEIAYGLKPEDFDEPTEPEES